VSEFKKQGRRSKQDLRPNEVPHHPKLITVGWVVGGVALALMGIWFWLALSGQGVLASAERESAAANAEVLAQEEAAEAEAEAQTQKAEAAPISPEVVDPELNLDAPKPVPTKAMQPKADTQAPTLSDTITDDWELNGWSVLSKDGKLVVSGQLNNISPDSQSGEITLAVYNNNKLSASSSLNVVDFPANTFERVEFMSEDIWTAGAKVVVLDYVPGG
jgi:hypothetical protein